MRRPLTCCNGTYARTVDGVWRYPWGDPVPGADDLILAHSHALGETASPEVLALRPLNDAELAWLRGEPADLGSVHVRDHPEGLPPSVGDLVLGMLAPELHALLMLTVSDIAALAGVSKTTVDSYRYRGYLPAPQATRGRTPLWARPIVHQWLRSRPGGGWRTDLYGSSDGPSPRQAG